MNQKPKSLKTKVIIGYLLLFVIAVVSVWFVYTEILKIAVPDNDADTDNKKIIQISTAIANLYASEAVGRNSILTGSIKDFTEYNKMLDSVNSEIEIIKYHAEPDQLSKFDSIQLLLNKKKKSITDIITFRKKYNQNSTFDKAVNGIYRTKDSLTSKVKPVKFKDGNQVRKVIKDALPPRIYDSLSKLQIPNDSLAMAFEDVLTDLVIKDNLLKFQLFKKEQKLQDENRIISDKLRVILSSLENEILQKSYVKIKQSKAAIDHTTQTMAWIGAGTFLLLIVFAWIIISDLSKNQRYRTQLEVLNIEKEDLLRSKMMLLATVTHDIQTPLGSIIGFSDLLKGTELNPKQKQYLDNVKHSSHYILKLVNDLIDFSKLENDKIKIEQISFNFKELIENTCQPLEPNALNKGIQLKWNIDEHLNNNYISDPYRIKQILTNLITNSIKFTQEGSVQVAATIQYPNARPFIVIQVIDTGIGIPKSQQEIIFKEFTQAHSGIEKKFGGTGLGLTIAQRILHLLGGDITVESEPLEGAVFTIKIPLEKSNVTDPIAQNTDAEKEYNFLRNKKILIIDDDAMQLGLMKEIFSNYPPEIKTTVDAALAIDILTNESFDLVLSDIQMPKIDGFELVNQIRNHKNPKISNLPVIALSGKRDLSMDDFTAKGFTSFHPKPIQLEALLSLLRDIFENRVILPLVIPAKIEYSDSLYDLSSLNQFTQNDPESLKLILRNFILSADENCELLLQKTMEQDQNAMSELAHKMIPMLKQMNVHSIVSSLEIIEDKKLAPNEEAIIFVKNVVASIQALNQKFEEDILN